MKYLIYICLGALILLGILALIYFILLFNLKGINKKIYKYKKEEDLKQKNILLVYQPSRHKTTFKIVELLKEVLVKKGYGVKIATLSKQDENYNEFFYTIFIVPVYFADINQEFINKVKNNKIKNLIIVYNGMNLESNNEDKLVKKESINKYSKIKVHTTDIDKLEEFINKEVL